MRYISTRGKSPAVTASEAILQGLATDGGLYVPETIPQIDQEFLKSLQKLSYQDRAKAILPLYLTDYTSEEIATCVQNAYNRDKFDNKDIAPLIQLSQDRYILELWHGPTSEFKDMALQLLPQLISTALRKVPDSEDLVILVATSGDTGKAALEGFKDVDRTKIIVFYPEQGVSDIQKLQMQTQAGNNLAVWGIDGNFDDAQTGVKNIFGDSQYAVTLQRQGYRLSSANSINWGRLLPQIIYYFSAYTDLVNSDRIKLGDKVDFTVPTGNFGDILAGYYAKRMGLPVNKLICASNNNKVLTEFLSTGEYNRKRDFYKTISPSMDILISSNLERLLYHVTEDSNQVSRWMELLNNAGTYTVDNTTLTKISDTFAGHYVDDVATKQWINDVYKNHDYVLDTHTAVAWGVAEHYQSLQNSSTIPMIVLSTASPYKFNASVLDALGKNTTGKDAFTLLTMLATINRQPIPYRLANLQNIKPIHVKQCAKNAMLRTVSEFLQS